jgi:hypothetical protein
MKSIFILTTVSLGLTSLIFVGCGDSGEDKVPNSELKSSASIYLDPSYKKIEIKALNANDDFYKYSLKSEKDKILFSREVKKGDSERIKCTLYSNEETLVSYDCDIEVNGKKSSEGSIIIYKGVHYILSVVDNNITNSMHRNKGSILIPK